MTEFYMFLWYCTAVQLDSFFKNIECYTLFSDSVRFWKTHRNMYPHLEGTGFVRVQNWYPDPYPSVPYLWNSLITHKTTYQGLRDSPMPCVISMGRRSFAQPTTGARMLWVRAKLSGKFVVEVSHFWCTDCGKAIKNVFCLHTVKYQ